MATRWQVRGLNGTEIFGDPPADCRCAWTNYSDYGGWLRTTTRPECPIHGASAVDRTPIELES